MKRRESKPPTSPISLPNLLYATPNAAFPAKGPSSHPTAPKPTVSAPSANTGSRPNISPPSESRSCTDRKATPATPVAALVSTDASRLYRRRTARRARKRSQVSGVCGWVVVEEDVDDEEEEWEGEEEGLLVDGAEAEGEGGEVLTRRGRLRVSLRDWVLRCR